MGSDSIHIDTVNPFNKQVGFVFSIRTRLTCLTNLWLFLYVYYYIYSCNYILILYTWKLIKIILVKYDQLIK